MNEVFDRKLIPSTSLLPNESRPTPRIMSTVDDTHISVDRLVIYENVFLVVETVTQEREDPGNTGLKSRKVLAAFKQKAHANTVARSKFEGRKAKIRANAETVLESYVRENEGREIRIKLDEDGNVLSGRLRSDDSYADVEYLQKLLRSAFGLDSAKDRGETWYCIEEVRAGGLKVFVVGTEWRIGGRAWGDRVSVAVERFEVRTGPMAQIEDQLPSFGHWYLNAHREED
jgi:hypothetical protein